MLRLAFSIALASIAGCSASSPDAQGDTAATVSQRPSTPLRNPADAAAEVIKAQAALRAEPKMKDSAEDYQRTYAKCVLDFSVSLVPSGEPAESLVRAGEAECVGQLSKMRASHALEDLELIKGRSDLTAEDAQGFTDIFVDGFKKSVHEQALRNVLVVKRDQAVKKRT